MTEMAAAAVALAALYWLPGAGLVELLWPALRSDPRHDRLSRFAVSAALSIAVRPVLVLWCRVADVPAGTWLAWTPAALGAGILAYGAWRRRRFPNPHARQGAGIGWIDALLALVVCLTVLSRWIAIQGVLVPAWGDSVQHSFITQLLLDNDGLFQSWAPYAPMESLTYHFGFHAMAAAWATITGATATDAVLQVGQATGVVAVLTLYSLTLQLTDGRRAAATGALLFAALLSPMPAFYVNWGRYTQLAGQALLPLLVCLLDVVWFDRKRSAPGVSVLLGIVLAGLCLTHYRVALLGGTAVLTWSVAATWRWRAGLREWLARSAGAVLAGLGAIGLIAPWLVGLTEGLLLAVHGTIGALDPGIFSFGDALRSWSAIPEQAPLPILVGIGVAAVAGVALRERSVLLVLAWTGLALLATNPFVLGLPGMGFVTNFAVGIAAYIPAAILFGWAIARCVPWFEARDRGRAVLCGSLALAALVGFSGRAARIDDEFQLVAASDLRAFEWIRANTPADARFQVNVALAYGGKTAVGTDAGWWLPLFTQRTATLPPLLYTIERMNERHRHDVWALPTWIKRSAHTPRIYHRNYCFERVTHLYLGEKRGSIGGDGTPLLPEDWVRKDPKMTLLFEDGRAQVWQFDGSECGNWPKNVRRTVVR